MSLSQSGRMIIMRILGIIGLFFIAASVFLGNDLRNKVLRKNFKSKASEIVSIEAVSLEDRKKEAAKPLYLTRYD